MCAPVSGSCSLPDIINSFRSKYPGLKVEVIQGDYDDVLEWTKAGITDIGFETLPTNEKLTEHTLYVDPLVCIAPSGFVPVNKKTITKKDISENVLIVQRDGYDTDTRAYLKKHKIKTHEQYYVDDDRAIISFVEAGLGLSLMPELALKGNDADVIKYPLELKESRTIGLIAQNKTNLSPAAGTMFDFIIEYVKDIID